MFKKEEIIAGLKSFPAEAVEQYASYCIATALKKDSKGADSFICKWNADKLITLFKRVASDGLYIDGKSISLSNRGVQYDYQAYKNKMYIVYPESIVDVQLVYKEDTFSFSKKSGEVFYSHDIGSPFAQKDDNIIGGYCVIKNKRGNFLTLLSKEDIDKHRKIATTDSIWKQWLKEMCLKTVIKKACSLHFKDIYSNIEDVDNENYNLENPIGIDIDLKSKIDDITDLEQLKAFYKDNKASISEKPETLKYIQIKQTELKKGA